MEETGSKGDFNHHKKADPNNDDDELQQGRCYDSASDYQNNIQQLNGSQVTLTRFQKLSVDELLINSSNCKNGEKTLSNGRRSNKWPWAVRKKEHQFNENNTDYSCDDNVNYEKEDFQIVWENLSFEISASSYEKLISHPLESIKSLICWPLKNLSAKREKDDSFNGSLNTMQTDAEQTKNSNDRFERGNKRIVFDNLNGLVKSGELSAILGPSGVGKSSLLNAICGKVENYRGSLKVMGGGSSQSLRLSLIPQKDCLLEMLTVRESLLYSSKLLNMNNNDNNKNNSGSSRNEGVDPTPFDHEANILRVIEMLNLQSCLDSSISRISGGEYKRVSIAQELLRQPDILVLDEPTSGLDSLNCKKLMRSLRNLIEASHCGTMQPIAILMTIHQPDIEIFNMFDRVYCMAHKGRVIYEGAPSNVLSVLREQAMGVENSEEASKKVSLINNPEAMELRLILKESEETYSRINPANLLIEIASGGIYGDEPIERLAKYHEKELATELLAQQQSKNEKLVEQDLSSVHVPENILEHSKQMKVQVAKQEQQKQPQCLVRDKRLTISSSGTKGSFWHQTNILIRRSFVSYLRDPFFSLSAILYYFVLPFGFSLIFNKKSGTQNGCPLIQRKLDLISVLSNETLDRQTELQEEVTSSTECAIMFYMIILSTSCLGLALNALDFPLKMHLLLKETRNGWYSASSFILARTIASFPYDVMLPCLSVIAVYLFLDLPDSEYQWRMWTIIFIIAISCMIVTIQGLCFGAICMNSVQTAIFTSLCSILPQALLSGSLARIGTMSPFMQGLSFFSFVRYSITAINLIRFGFGMCPCDETTEIYLQQNPASFDLDERMRPLFSYYLTHYMTSNNEESSADDADVTDEAPTTTSSLTTQVVATNSNNSTSLTSTFLMTNNNSSSNNSLLIDYGDELLARTSDQAIAGVNNSYLLLNSTSRQQLIDDIDSKRLDPLNQMATLMSSSFSYGHRIDHCDIVRAQYLVQGGAPPDSHLPYMILALVGLLILYQILLFVIIRLKIGS